MLVNLNSKHERNKKEKDGHKYKYKTLVRIKLTQGFEWLTIPFRIFYISNALSKLKWNPDTQSVFTCQSQSQK